MRTSPFLDLRQTRSKSAVLGKFLGADVFFSGAVTTAQEQQEQRAYQPGFSAQFPEMPENEGC
jgi:hypothetical protein